MMNFNEDYILENDFVKLTPLEPKHVSELLEISNEPDIWTYSFIKGNGLENLTDYIESTVQARKSKKEYPFLVFDKIQNKVAGCTRYYDIIPSLQSLRVGYTWYGKDFRGTKLNKSCKYLLFDFAFNHLNFERIGLGAYAENKISIAAMESVGCTKEGIFRNFLPTKNGRTDAVLYSILKNEWEMHEKTALYRKIESTFNQ